MWFPECLSISGRRCQGQWILEALKCKSGYVLSTCASSAEGKMTATPLSHPSAAIWQPHPCISTAAGSPAICWPFSFPQPLRPEWINFWNLQSQMYGWELNTDEKLLEKGVGVAGKQHYLSPMASVRSSSTSPGCLAVLWAPAESDACSRSPGHFWLLTLCLSPLMGVFCSMTSQERRGKPHLLAQVFLYSSDPLSFTHQHSWIHQFLWQHPWLQAASGVGQSQNIILVHLSPWKVLQKHEVTARKGWKFYLALFFLSQKTNIFKL